MNKIINFFMHRSTFLRAFALALLLIIIFIALMWWDNSINIMPEALQLKTK